MSKRNHGVLVALVVSCAMTLPGLTAFAQEGGVERRITEVRQQIREVVNRGEELEQRGQREEARAMFNRAEAMQTELRAWIEQLEREGREHRTGQEHARREGGHFINVIEHLEHAMVILEEHGNGELAMQIDNVADQMRERLQRHQADRDHEQDQDRESREGERSERDVARAQIETLHLALNVLREAERRDAVDLVHRAIRAREVGLEGRRDEEARHIRERSPNHEQVRRLLGMGVELYQEFGAHERAERLAGAARRFFPPQGESEAGHERERDREHDGDREQREHEGERDRPGRGDRAFLAHQIEVMRVAMPAILEAGRKDTAELLEHAIHARELMLEGVRSDKAREVIESAPDLGAMVEILGWASRLWDEFGHEGKARTVGELAGRLREEWQARRERTEGHEVGRERERESRDEAERAHDQKMEALERRLAELEAALEHTQAQLRERGGEGRRRR